jgi:hypothetical protein
MKGLLLLTLGDLEEVWADAALQETLLALPLSAMAVLLGCTELKVSKSGPQAWLQVCVLHYARKMLLSSAVLAQWLASIVLRLAQSLHCGAKSSVLALGFSTQCWEQTMPFPAW